MSVRRAWVGTAVLVTVLGAIAWWSPAPDRVTDRGVYEATAARGIVPDCSDLHCFRVLVAWTLGSLPGASALKWTIYAVVAIAAAAVAVFLLALAFGLRRRAALIAALLSAFGFGSLYTLHDPFTSDPLMYALAPLVTWLLLRDRLVIAGGLATVGVLAKEFVVAPVYMFAAVALAERRWLRAGRVLIVANTAFLVWLGLQFTLILGYNYGYGDNPSTHLLGGGYLFYWLEQQSPRGAFSALFNEFGALYLLAPAGFVLAPARLRRLALAGVPVAAVFAYVQQPDRALWNLHFLVTPLAGVILDRAPAAIAWGTVATFVLANLRLGAQLPWIPAARFALAVSCVLAVMAIVAAWRTPRRVKMSGVAAAA